jgi:branched-chain amino acid transport system substrate-binding protein
MRRVVVLAGCGLLAAGCGGGGGGGGSAASAGGAATGDTIVIGTALSQTGQLSKEGALTKQGYDLWLDWINGKGGIVVNGVRHPVQIAYEDDQSKSDQSAILIQKLITTEKAQFLLGPYGSAATATDAVVAEKNGIPMVEANGAAQAIFSKGYQYTFGVLSPADKYLEGVLEMAATLDPKPVTVAMLSADDSFSQEVAQAVVDTAPSKGMRVVFNERYPNGSTDLSGLLSRAKGQSPDIVLNSGHLAEAIAINKAAKDLQVDAKIFAYSVGPSTPDFVTALGTDANYVYDGSQWTPQVRYTPDFYLSVSEYTQAYEKRFTTTEPPDYHVAESTAACLALQRAMEKAGSLEPTRVRAALTALDVTTFFGRIKFDSRGVNTVKPMVVEQIQHGVHYTVFPADVANGKPLYPTPPWDRRG